MKALKSILYSLIVLLVLFSTASAAPILQEPSEILYVKQGGIGECSSWEDACDLQTAIGKEPYKIYVAEGTYHPSLSDREDSFNLVNGLQIFGGFPAEGGTWEERDWQEHDTILSGDIDGDGTLEKNSYHVLRATDVNHLARLDGFTVTGGNADLGGSLDDSSGAGMYNDQSSPILSNLNFIGNSANYGAGMYNDASSPTLTNVIFSQNSAIVLGGGMFNDGSSPELTNVTFSANSSNGHGGGLYNEENSSPVLTDVTFTNHAQGGMYNHSSSPTLNNVRFLDNSANRGGGMLNQSSSPKLSNVTFSGNTGTLGGALHNSFSNPTLFNVTFFDNRAIYDAHRDENGVGGGMYNYESSPELTNVTFSANTSSGHGGGLYNEENSNPSLINVTLFGNTATGSGGGIYNWSPDINPTDIINTILWGNTADADDSDQIYVSGSTSPIVSYSVIQGGCPTGATCDVIITKDPLLGSLADNGGFTQTHALLPGSSAIDAGDMTVCPETDQRGYSRPIGAGCDIGAYEYGYTLDVLIEGNGSVFIDPLKPEYNLDEQVALTATADPGWTFSGWSGNATVTDNLVTITKDTNLTATFTQDEYILTVIVDPEDSGTVTLDPPQGPYHYGEEVTLTPTANTGYTFDGWSGAEVKDNTVTITGNTTVTANFTQIEYTLTVNVDPEESGIVTLDPPDGPYYYEDVVTLTPTANPGYTFDSWSGAEVKDNTVTITGDTTVTAHFTQDEQGIYLPLILR